MSGVLLDATTVVLGDKEVSSSSERIAVEATKGITGHIHITTGICCDGEACSNFSSNPQLSGVLLDATTVVLGHKEVVGSSERIAVEATIGITGHIHITTGICCYGQAPSLFSSNPQLSGVLLDATTVVFGDKEVVGSSERIAVEATLCITSHIDITTGICCYGVAQSILSSNPQLFCSNPRWDTSHPHIGHIRAGNRSTAIGNSTSEATGLRSNSYRITCTAYQGCGKGKRSAVGIDC